MEDELVSKSEKVLGTLVEIKLLSKHQGLFAHCFSELHRIEQAYSRFLDTSQLSILNSNLGTLQNASQEMIWLLAKAQEIKSKTEGNFDIGLKQALENLGYDKQYSFKPKKVVAPLPSVSGENYSIDVSKRRVKLYRQVEFGGFGKGFALDRVASLLEKNGVRHYYVNAGGDIFAKKGKGEKDWIILLEHPDDPSKAIGTLKLDGMAIAASAPNRRKWGDYHHLLNARTQMPAQGVKSIFVTAKTGLEADAYATALFTAGFEQGITLSHRLPVEMLVVSSENKMYRSKGFAAELFE